jgi:hypothetical protein
MGLLHEIHVDTPISFCLAYLILGIPGSFVRLREFQLALQTDFFPCDSSPLIQTEELL